MTKQVLELNNVDIYGRRFNGYSLTEYINQNSDHYTAKFLVNHKYSKDSDVVELFSTEDLTNFDWQIEPLEEKLFIKNQISITEDALIRHPLYQSADLLHFHMYHNMHLPIEYLTRIKDKHIVIDVHDTFWLTDQHIPMLEVFKYSDQNKTSLDAQRKRVLNSIDADFVVHSPFMLNLFKKSDATKNLRVHLIPFGIDTEVFKPQKVDRKKYQIPDDSYVIFCRSQKEFKGIDYIESALKNLQTDRDITIVTVGVKGLLDSIKDKFRLIELGTLNSEKELAEVYNLSDLFLAPSTEESFGFMAVEAMSCEKPVVVFEGTALPDTVNAPEIGIATKRNTKELKKAIEHLLANPKECKSRGTSGRKYVLKNYTEQKYFTSYLKLFDDIINTKPKTPTPSESKVPDNLNKLSAFLDGKLPDEKFDFNNTAIQTEIKNYNSRLYSKILKQSHRITPKKIIKKMIRIVRK